MACATAQAQYVAPVEQAEAAKAHYAKARALLVEALQEFELGRRMARPDLLIDSEEWRISVVSRTEELNRVLDPQPRVTRGGVRIQANQRLIKGEGTSDFAPIVEVQSSNTHGEERRARELEIGREQAEAAEATSVLEDEARSRIDISGLEDVLEDSQIAVDAAVVDTEAQLEQKLYQELTR